MKLRIHFDGGSRGNPGPAGAGVVIEDEQAGLLLEAGFFLGRMTNNMAEYHALLRALDFAARAGGKTLAIRSDSELLVRQLTGKYRVRSPALKGLFAESQDALRHFESWELRHVRRELNQRADAMANRAMDAGEDVVATEELAPTRSPTTGFAPANPGVVAECILAPNPDVCPAPCKVGTKFRIEAVSPQGICLGVAVELLDAARRGAGRSESVEMDCPLAGCGARFRLLPT